MKMLVLPIAAIAVLALLAPATAGEGCMGSEHKDQTAEKPLPEPAPAPST